MSFTILGVVPGLDPGTHSPFNPAMSAFVYILASRKHGTLYIGVTNDVARRVWEHRQGLGSRFAARHGATRLVHVEAHDDIASAIQREKTLKEWNRAWKVALVERGNPEWRDLYDDLNGQALEPSGQTRG
ncbi:MAG TPA: GIY-YIG nuclease family protein [Devosiaceae bacterium]